MSDPTPSDPPVSPDQVIDAFEDAWQKQCHATIARLLRQPNLPADLLAELIMIDIEYRWRYPLPDADRRLAVVPNHPRVEDYLHAAPTLHSEPDLILDLLGEEYRARLRWGEPTQASAIADRFPALRTPFLSLADRIEQETPHACISVLQSGTSLFSTRIFRSLIVGRQSIQQPPPFSLVIADQQWKLVVAPLRNVQISRQQLEITFSNPDVELKNLSQNVSLKFDSGLRLPPGKSTRQNLPFSLRLDTLCLQIDRRRQLAGM
ncbi:MAG: hypothetical protein R3C05_01620 [Pirellulaceae bacterium]